MGEVATRLLYRSCQGVNRFFRVKESTKWEKNELQHEFRISGGLRVHGYIVVLRGIGHLEGKITIVLKQVQHEIPKVGMVLVHYFPGDLMPTIDAPRIFR